MEFSIVMGMAEFAVDPTARNSNLLPVKAKGEVRFLSVLSLRSSGILGMPSHSIASSFTFLANREDSTSFNMAFSWVPRDIDMIAGGASLAARRWSFPASAIDARRRSVLVGTALMVQIKKLRSMRLFLGVLRGDRRLMPLSVIKDHLLCVHEPFIPL